MCRLATFLLYALEERAEGVEVSGPSSALQVSGHSRALQVPGEAGWWAEPAGPQAEWW